MSIEHIQTLNDLHANMIGAPGHTIRRQRAALRWAIEQLKPQAKKLSEGELLEIAASAFGHDPCPNGGRCFTPQACGGRGHCGSKPMTSAATPARHADEDWHRPQLTPGCAEG